MQKYTTHPSFLLLISLLTETADYQSNLLLKRDSRWNCQNSQW